MATSFDDWMAGARPRTLWTAITPVLVGTAAADAAGASHFLFSILALGVGLALQVGVNFANDYSDGVRGTDVDRIGPDRLVATGKATPSAVKAAALGSFGVAAVLGLALVALSGYWWLLGVGLVAIVAAWYYTGSERPYGYAGWGEVSVFVFFGPVATLGTMYTQAGRVTWWAVLASFALGLWAVAMLLVNNIRDIETDAAAGKRTLAVRVGDFRARQLYAASVSLPLILSVLIAFAQPWVLITLLLLLPVGLLVLGMRLRVGAALKPLFLGTSAVGLVYGCLLAVGIAL
ncbi:1,4-dihydroxy-2-naphthoate polyprenyltransferase [Demequina sp.]|uniref:1,4-dihydroxy-2-naphthoate polyprenyltransferase n=1 Tax=Demequina sp. TaxID=2050685 RepID=UPI003D0DEF2C